MYMYVYIYTHISYIYTSHTRIYILYNWDSLHARLKRHYKGWSYKKKTKRIKHTGNLFKKIQQIESVC